MAIYAKINSSDNSVITYPYTLREFQEENPTTKINTRDLAAAYDGTEDQISSGHTVVIVNYVDLPSITSIQTLVENSPILNSDTSEWEQSWSVQDKSAEEISSILTGENKVKRQGLLERSDFTQLSDAPITDAQKADYATYRQELRDITSHANWPVLEDTDWPVDPHGLLIGAAVIS